MKEPSLSVAVAPKVPRTRSTRGHELEKRQPAFVRLTLEALLDGATPNEIAGGELHSQIVGVVWRCGWTAVDLRRTEGTDFPSSTAGGPDTADYALLTLERLAGCTLEYDNDRGAGAALGLEHVRGYADCFDIGVRGVRERNHLCMIHDFGVRRTSKPSPPQGSGFGLHNQVRGGSGVLRRSATGIERRLQSLRSGRSQ
jgi:hypothetical protein